MGSLRDARRRATTRFDIEDVERIKKNTIDSFQNTGNGGDDGGCGVGGAFDVESRNVNRVPIDGDGSSSWRWVSMTRRANGEGCMTDGTNGLK